MSSLGDFDLSTVVYGKFTTYRPSTGAPYTLAGTPALSVYKDNSTTQSTTGVTLTVDFDSVTGLHHFAIDTSADGTFYSSGSFFDVVITTGTVDSVSAVGTVVGRFTLRKNSALKPTTAGRALVVDASGLADANMVKMGPTGSGTAQTARDIGASVLLSSGTGTRQLSFTSGIVQADLQTIKTQTVTCSGGVTVPAATLASTTNITAGTITTVTTVTNQLTAAQIATGIFQDTTAGDFTVANSIGKSIMNGVSLGTGLTVARCTLTDTLTTNSDKTGYSLTQTFPSNFSSLGINASGHISRVTLVDTTTTNTDMLTAVGVWAAGTRTLTANTNFNDPTAAAIATAVLTTAMTESYRATNAAPTLAQSQFELIAHMGEKSISSTTYTLKKLDGSTTAKTYTLNDAVKPTAITETT